MNGPAALWQDKIKADIELEPLMPFPISEQRIIEAEAALGRTLLQELRQRLMRNSGGEVVVEADDWFLHPVWNPTNHRTTGRTANHIFVETAAARSWASFPPDEVSLASDGSGDRLITCGNGDHVSFVSMRLESAFLWVLIGNEIPNGSFRGRSQRWSPA